MAGLGGREARTQAGTVVVVRVSEVVASSGAYVYDREINEKHPREAKTHVFREGANQWYLDDV